MHSVIAAVTLSRPSPIRIVPMIKLHTNHGVISVELFEDKAPETTANFKEYVKSGHYDGTVFHRVISNFMIQGGGFEPGMKQKTTRAPIKNEANNGLSNKTGTLAMARTMEPHSASAQFFIEKIKGVSTTMKSGHQDVPVDDVVIEKAEIVE